MACPPRFPRPDLRALAWPVSAVFISAVFASDAPAEDPRPPEVEALLPGVSLTEVASHPDIATPTGVDVDDEGKVWAVSSHTHFPPEDYSGPEFDEILVFDPASGERRVFDDRGVHTMDLELGPGGSVYLAERSRILRLHDSDGDGRSDPDGREILAELDTEEDYPHNGLSGLAWDGEGRLLFSLGENFAQPWTLTSSDGRKFIGRGEGGIFRCLPDGSEMERLALGMWNPFGVVALGNGEIFAVENDPGASPPCRLLHVVPGARFGYQRAYGNAARHPFVAWNGELRGTLPMVHPVGEAPCGVVELGGRGLLAASWSDHRVDFIRLSWKGASFDAEQVRVLGGGRYFRPVGIARDPAPESESGPLREPGRLRWYLTDWVDGSYKLHGYGRLWKLEIDLEEAAGWLGNPGSEKPTPEAMLAGALRRGEGKWTREELFAHASGEDPHLAAAGISALAREAKEWTEESFAAWPPEHRAIAALALRESGEDWRTGKSADEREKADNPGANDPGERWLPLLLADESPEVRFEALRWVSDEMRTALLPRVEELLAAPDLDFALFEATVAARNALLGVPEKGARDEELLLARVRDGGAPAALRAHALRMLPTFSTTPPKEGGIVELRFPKGLDLNTLRSLLAEGDPQLSLEAVRVLASAPERGGAALAEAAVDESLAVNARAEAVSGLAPVAGDHRSALLELARAPEAAVREEAIRCFRSTPPADEAERAALEAVAEIYPESAPSVRAALDPASLTGGRPPLTDTDAWLARLAAVEEPVDAEHGRRTFFHRTLALCSTCHTHDGRGRVVGPDLTQLHLHGVGPESADGETDGGETGALTRFILESILDPNREIAPEYQPRLVRLKNGESHTGIRLQSSTREVIRDPQGLRRVFDRDGIESMEELPVSLMPAGLPLSLTDRELRDLVAFLASGDREK